MDIIKIKFYNYFSLKRNASTVLKLFIIETSRFREVKIKRNVWSFLTNLTHFSFTFTLKKKLLHLFPAEGEADSGIYFGSASPPWGTPRT